MLALMLDQEGSEEKLMSCTSQRRCHHICKKLKSSSVINISEKMLSYSHLHFLRKKMLFMFSIHKKLKSSSVTNISEQMLYISEKMFFYFQEKLKSSSIIHLREDVLSHLHFLREKMLFMFSHLRFYISFERRCCIMLTLIIYEICD